MISGSKIRKKVISFALCEIKNKIHDFAVSTEH